MAKTLKFNTYSYTADKIVKTATDIIFYNDDTECRRISPYGKNINYVVYNEDGTVSDFDTDIGFNSTITAMAKLIYKLIKDNQAMAVAIDELNKKIGG